MGNCGGSQAKQIIQNLMMSTYAKVGCFLRFRLLPQEEVVAAGVVWVRRFSGTTDSETGLSLKDNRS